MLDGRLDDVFRKLTTGKERCAANARGGRRPPNQGDNDNGIVEHIKAIFKRELESYFDSPVAYVFLVVFLMLVNS